MLFKRRFLAFLIDYMIFALFFTIICTVFYVAEQFFIVENGPTFYMLYGILLLFTMLLFIAKDCYRGKSIGKKLEKLKVVSNRGDKATIFQLFIRNITILIWPVEFLLLLLDKEKLGDRLANTMVTDAEGR